MLTAERLAELIRDPDVVALLAYVGELNRQIGQREAEQDMQRAWSTAARRVRRVLARPTHSELQRRRGS